LIKIAAAVGLFWFGYAQIYNRGYSARDGEYVAVMKAANAEIARLNASLEAENAADELRRSQSEADAVAGIPSLDECALSQCALTVDAIARLNKVN